MGTLRGTINSKLTSGKLEISERTEAKDVTKYKIQFENLKAAMAKWLR